MSTLQQTSYRLNLSQQLSDLLDAKAQRLGIPATLYIKHLIINDVKDEEYPTFAMSKKTKEEIANALQHINDAVDADVFFQQDES